MHARLTILFCVLLFSPAFAATKAVPTPTPLQKNEADELRSEARKLEIEAQTLQDQAGKLFPLPRPPVPPPPCTLASPPDFNGTFNKAFAFKVIELVDDVPMKDFDRKIMVKDVFAVLSAPAQVWCDKNGKALK